MGRYGHPCVGVCCSSVDALGLTGDGAIAGDQARQSGRGVRGAVRGAPPSWLAGTDPVRVSFVPGSPIYVTIYLPTCLNSCTTGTATCDVAVSGKVIRIASEGQLTDTGAGYEAGFTGPRMCTAACFGLIARCQSAPLTAGRYEVRYGKEKHVLIVPSAPLTERLCLGRRE